LLLPPPLFKQSESEVHHQRSNLQQKWLKRLRTDDGRDKKVRWKTQAFDTVRINPSTMQTELSFQKLVKGMLKAGQRTLGIFT
jgi:hypothetical protein